MYKFSQFIFCPFLHGCISFRVFFAVPYSCLLFKICAAYAEVVLLDLMCRICSLCLVVMGLPDCPTYFLLHVLHFISYIPLGFLFCVFSANCWYIVFVALNAMRISVLLNKLVTLHIIGLWYVNVTHCFCICLSCVSFVWVHLSLFLALSFFSMSVILCMGKH
jgi:hypothetical protein